MKKATKILSTIGHWVRIQTWEPLTMKQAFKHYARYPENVKFMVEILTVYIIPLLKCILEFSTVYTSHLNFIY